MKKQTVDKLMLEVKKRDVFGKKLKAVRKQGHLPANIFGEDIPSQSIIASTRDFVKIFKKAGETQIVTLKLDDQEIPVLVKKVQKHPLSRLLLHVDFRKVDLKKKIETEVPIKLIGVSDAIIQNKGVLLTLAESVMVEALPNAIPSAIEIDITTLKELNDEIKVKDLKTNPNYVFKDEPDKVIVRISAHKEESIETQVVAPETVEVTTEKKEETAPEEATKGEKAEKSEKPTGKPVKEETKKEEKK